MSEPVLLDTGPLVAYLDRREEHQRKYRQVPMAYADACLLWLADNIRLCRVLTVDSDLRSIGCLVRARCR